MDITCFDNIIGLSRTECECYDTGKPADYNTSLSGLYLDELEPLTAFKGLLNCERGTDIWDALDRSREQAILNWRAEANALLLKNNKLLRRPFKGKIGRLKYTREEVITSGDWVGIRMYCSDIVSGKIVINNIGTLFSDTGVITLRIYNNLNTLISSHVLNTTANTHTLNTVSIELPIHSDWTDNLEYFFIYQKNGLTPKENSSFCCDCSKTVECGCDIKYVNSQTNKNYGWAEWCAVDGFKKTDISDLSDLEISSSNKMYGLTFGIEYTCDVEDVWCKDELDFDSSTIPMAMALAIRYKAGELFINDLILSSNLNYNKLINGEAQAELKVYFKEQYDKQMEFIIDNIDVRDTDCFVCADSQIYGKALIAS